MSNHLRSGHDSILGHAQLYHSILSKCADTDEDFSVLKW